MPQECFSVNLTLFKINSKKRSKSIAALFILIERYHGPITDTKQSGSLANYSSCRERNPLREEIHEMPRNPLRENLWR